jgi:hypothetical protein
VRARVFEFVFIAVSMCEFAYLYTHSLPHASAHKPSHALHLTFVFCAARRTVVVHAERILHA